MTNYKNLKKAESLLSQTLKYLAKVEANEPSIQKDVGSVAAHLGDAYIGLLKIDELFEELQSVKASYNKEGKQRIDNDLIVLRSYLQEGK